MALLGRVLRLRCSKVMSPEIHSLQKWLQMCAGNFSRDFVSDLARLSDEALTKGDLMFESF